MFSSEAQDKEPYEKYLNLEVKLVDPERQFLMFQQLKYVITRFNIGNLFRKKFVHFLQKQLQF